MNVLTEDDECLDSTSGVHKTATYAETRRDTIREVPEEDHGAISPIHNFLNEFGMTYPYGSKRKGLSLEDGRKMDVIIEANGLIRLEYETPIIINGEQRGYTGYDFIFSVLSGDCLIYDYHDRFDFDASTPKGLKMRIDYCTIRRPDWRQVLFEFEIAFRNANLY